MRMTVKASARKPKQTVKSKQCNCKNSKCLKLYCECFASGRYCDNCNCVNCFNNHENEAVRQQAVEGILERNPNAFRPKIQTADGEATRSTDGVRHCKGCNCKKSGCLKKYCECFQGNIYCSEICKCHDCKNYEGSEQREHVMRMLGNLSIPTHAPGTLGAAAHAHAQAGLKRPRALASPQPSPGAALPPPGALPLLMPLGAGAGGPLPMLMPPGAMGGGGLPGLQPLALAPQLSGLMLGRSASPPPASGVAYEVLGEVLTDGFVDGLCNLLLILAKEEGQRHDAATGGGAGGVGGGEEGQQRQGQEAAAAAEGAGAAEQQAQPMDLDGAPGGPQGEQQGGQQAGPPAEQQQQQQPPQPQPPAVPMDIRAALAAAHAAVQAADAEAAAGGDKQRRPQQGGGGGGCGGGGMSDRYAAQELAVLTEFHSILQRVNTITRKKISEHMQASAAAAAAAAGPDGLEQPPPPPLLQLPGFPLLTQQADGGGAGGAGAQPLFQLPGGQVLLQPGALMGLMGAGGFPLAALGPLAGGGGDGIKQEQQPDGLGQPPAQPAGGADGGGEAADG